MFTIKLYADGGFRQKVLEGEAFTVIREDGRAEITIHGMLVNGAREDCRFDVADAPGPGLSPDSPVFERAIIENSMGKTTEIIYAPSMFSQRAA